MKRLHKVMDFCIRHQTILGRSIVSLLTVAGEQISYVVFKCPCNSWNMLYGCSFLLAPAFVLFLLGFMVNPRTWRLMTGKCKCSLENDHGCSPWGPSAHFCQVLLPMTAKALVAPLTWIAVALLRPNFYECAASGSSLTARYFCKDNGTDCRKQLFQMPCNDTLLQNIPEEKLSLHAQSQLLGMLLIAVSVTVALISKCVRHYGSKLNYLQLKVWKIYTKEECEVFEKKAKEHATKLAERNTNCFFEATDPEPFNVPTKDDWKGISAVYTFDSERQEYSTLHKYVNSKLKKGGQDCPVSGNGNEAGTSTCCFPQLFSCLAVGKDKAENSCKDDFSVKDSKSMKRTSEIELKAISELQNPIQEDSDVIS